MDRERFEKQLNFILEIDKEKQILRQTHIRGYSRQEDDAEANKTKDEREHKAAERIYGLLPEDQGKMLMDLWLEFEAYETPEARFAHVMDNFQPLLLNHENDGKDWTRHNVRISQPLKRNEKTTTGSEEIWSYMEEILEQSIRDGKIIDDREEKQE